MKSTLYPFSACVLAIAIFATAGCGILTRRSRTQVGKLPVATPDPTATPVPFSIEDKKFLSTASQIFAYHRRLGALARQYGNSEAARGYGEQMEVEMGLAQDSLKVLADSKEQKITNEMGAWGKGGLGRVDRPGSQGFDRAFYEELKRSGTQAYEVFDREFRAVVDGEVKEFVKRWYPVLRDFPREAIKEETQMDKGRR